MALNMTQPSHNLESELSIVKIAPFLWLWDHINIYSASVWDRL